MMLNLKKENTWRISNDVMCIIDIPVYHPRYRTRNLINVPQNVCICFFLFITAFTTGISLTIQDPLLS